MTSQSPQAVLLATPPVEEVSVSLDLQEAYPFLVDYLVRPHRPRAP